MSTDRQPEPLILTLEMDDASQERFDRLREAHFPPERNFLRAHLTLFHKLPGEQEPNLVADLREVCRETEPIALRAMGLRFLGKGVAFDLHSPELETLRRELAARWFPWLAPQDRQRIKPHVTVQNKVSPGRARALHGELSAGFSPFEVWGEGLSLWRYLGGPWEPVGSFPFSGGPR
jgi:2'-5' RNA ligase